MTELETRNHQIAINYERSYKIHKPAIALCKLYLTNYNKWKLECLLLIEQHFDYMVKIYKPAGDTFNQIHWLCHQIEREQKHRIVHLHSLGFVLSISEPEAVEMQKTVEQLLIQAAHKKSCGKIISMDGVDRVCAHTLPCGTYFVATWYEPPIVVCITLPVMNEGDAKVIARRIEDMNGIS